MKRYAFSLIEVMIAVVLVGLAVVSLVAANSVFTQNNSAALDISTAEYLIEQIRELTMLLPVVDPETQEYFITKEATLSAYDNIGDFDNETFSPPIDADRNPLNVFADFAQKVTVQKVNPSDFRQVELDGYISSFVRVTVDIYHHGRKLASESWIRAKY